MSRELPFADAIVINLNRQREILRKKVDLIDKIVALVEDNPDAAKFAEMMHELQQVPGQPQGQ
jgi:hypothetical protein